MSWMKEQAAKARRIDVTAEDELKATEKSLVTGRTAPGQFMQLQATAERQRKEIAELKDLMLKSGRARRPISQMHEIPGRRRKLSEEQYAELKANLSKYPLVHPVVLEARPDGQWNIGSGNNRVAAYRDLGFEDIDSIISDADPELSERLGFFSNLFSPSLPDFEKYQNFQKLQVGADSLTRQELAEAIGLSPSHVHKIFAFEGLPDQAKAILSERPDRLGANVAMDLARAASEGRSDQVVEAVQRLVNDESFLQKDAATFVKPKRPTTPKPQSMMVKVGRKKFCDVTAHNGAIGIRFADKSDDAEMWALEIRKFIEEKLAKKG